MAQIIIGVACVANWHDMVVAAHSETASAIEIVETPIRVKPIQQPVATPEVVDAEVELPVGPSALELMVPEEIRCELPDPDAKIVVISLAAQRLWAFCDQDVVLESPVVTGKPTAARSTRPGLFAVTEKRTKTRLRGSYGVSQPVACWMRFNDQYSQGLHDASWQAQFGGDWYIEHGSHGCVNLPVDFSPLLYDFVEIGTPVLVLTE